MTAQHISFSAAVAFPLYVFAFLTSSVRSFFSSRSPQKFVCALSYVCCSSLSFFFASVATALRYDLHPLSPSTLMTGGTPVRGRLGSGALPCVGGCPVQPLDPCQCRDTCGGERAKRLRRGEVRAMSRCRCRRSGPGWARCPRDSSASQSALAAHWRGEAQPAREECTRWRPAHCCEACGHGCFAPCDGPCEVSGVEGGLPHLRCTAGQWARQRSEVPLVL